MPKKQKSWKCSSCSSCFGSLEAVNSHAKAKHKGKSVHCSECGRIFGSKDAINQHRNTIHRFRCSGCHYTFTTESERVQHYATAHRRVDCPECGGKFDSRESMNQHYDEVHNCLNCPQCDERFSTRKLMDQHFDATHSWVDCPECNFSAMAREVVDQHHGEVHRWVNCPECYGEFGTSKAMNQHYDAEHGTICPVCDREFMTRAAANEHYDTGHNLENCPECDWRFGTTELMNRHHSAVHRWVTCPECYGEFGTLKAMNQHYDAEHGFICPVCDREFMTWAEADQHYETNHRTLECSECDCGFGTEEAMAQHYYTNHCFGCSDCGGEFPTQVKLDKHCYEKHGILEWHEWGEVRRKQSMEQHSDSKHQFRCSECSAEFVTRAMMDQHYNANHQFKCGICSSYFTTAFGAHQHREAYHGFRRIYLPETSATEGKGNKMNQNLPCPKCARKFVSAAALRFHEENEHKTYLCPKCPEEFGTQEAVNQHVSEDHKSSFKETMTCEHCLFRFTSPKDLKQHKIAFHSWKCTKCPTLPPFEDGTAWHTHFNAVHAASAQSGKITNTKGKEVAIPTNEGKIGDKYRGAIYDTNTKAQSIVTRFVQPHPAPPNLEDSLISNPPSEVLLPNVNRDQNTSFTFVDKAESRPVHHAKLNLENQTAPFDERGPSSSNGPTPNLLVGIYPQQRWDGVAYETASGVWSPAMTVSPVRTDRPEEDCNVDMLPPRSVGAENGQHITDPPRVSKLGERDSLTLSDATRTDHSRDESNVRTQNVRDGTTPSPMNSEQYEDARSDSPTSTSPNPRNAERDTKQGDLSHDDDSLQAGRSKRSKPGSPEVFFGCRICFSGPTPTSILTATSCGHLFCYECIVAEVLETSKCPVCKDALVLYCLFKLDLVPT